MRRAASKNAGRPRYCQGGVEKLERNGRRAKWDREGKAG